MPIGGATAPEEGGRGSELGEFNVSTGSWSSTGEEGVAGMHACLIALYLQEGTLHLGNEGLGGEQAEASAEASDAIPKKRAKQSIKATI